jgi:hypothetical protein
MRRQLQKKEGERQFFRGTYERSGTKHGWNNKTAITLLFKEITDVDGNIVCNHLWFNYTKEFEKLFPWKTGEIAQFAARVTRYVKGYAGHKEDVAFEKPRQLDFKLSRPTCITKILVPPRA